MASLIPGPTRVRYPSGPDAGQLADRYGDFSLIPYWLQPLAQQLGAAGYWYVPPADPLDTLGDQATTAVDSTEHALAAGVNTVSDAILSVGSTSLVWAIAGLAAVLVLRTGRR